MASVWIAVLAIFLVVLVLSVFSNLSFTETPLGQLAYQCMDLSIKRLETETREATQGAKADGNLWKVGYAEGMGRAIMLLAFSLGSGPLITRAQVLQSELQESLGTLRGDKKNS